MSEDRSQWAARLKDVGEGKLCWISSSSAGLTEGTPWKGKTGWLRFLGDESCVQADELGADDGWLMSGEWLELDGCKTVRAERDPEGVILRSIGEVTESATAFPAIRVDYALLGEGGTKFCMAVYYGFRSEADFEEGRLNRLAERFTGVGKGMQP